MIAGIGTDLCQTSRIERAIARHGERFLGFVFHPDEIARARSLKKPFAYYAGRFAVKEAFLKALRVGIFNGEIALHEIRTVNDAQGVPELTVTGVRGDEKLDGMKVHVSISHDGDYALAMVVLETIAP